MFPSINNSFISDSFSDNTLYFWKYPEDEEKKKAPIEAEGISLHNCFTENVSLAPREVCSRPNTFMLECRRPFKSGDVDGLNTRVVSFFAFLHFHHIKSACLTVWKMIVPTIQIFRDINLEQFLIR